MRLRSLSLLMLLLPVMAMADGISDLLKKTGNQKDYPDARQVVVFDSTSVVVNETGLGLFYFPTGDRGKYGF